MGDDELKRSKDGREAAAVDAAEMGGGRVGKVALVLARPVKAASLSSLTTGRRIGWGCTSLVDYCSSADVRYK
jgi:hypothetical protein